MKKKQIFNPILLILFIVSGIFISCDSDKLEDEAYYTFTGETVASFCKNNRNLSVFFQLIEDSESYSLLSLYGHFTCFVPTDSAFNAYFTENGITYESLSKEEKKEIVYNHTVNHPSVEFLTTDFENGAMKKPNMNDRYLFISFGSNGSRQITYVNKNSPIISEDNEVHNGVVHVVGKVVNPSQAGLASVVSDQADFKIFAKALELTHLSDSIMGVEDNSYLDPYVSGITTTDVRGYNVGILRTKKLGYTVFAEPDEVFKNAGINNIDDLVIYAKKYYGSEDLSDYTSRKNPLNKFVSYHILDRQMSTNSLVYLGPNTSPYARDQLHEYYETMLKMRLIEIKAGNKINTQKNGIYVGINEAKSNLDGINGLVHSLTNILVYDENVMVNDVLNKRLRIDAFAIPPALTNNNIRWKLAGTAADKVTVAPNFCGEYLKFNDATDIILWASNSWDDHQADEMSFRGWYDFTFRLPPVPPGTYEVRLGYSCRDWGGVTQVFFDGNIIGIPIDFKTNGKDPSIGWIKDSETLDNGVENDKMMRNKGYMKGGKAICNSGWGNASNRDGSGDLRIIIGTFTFQDYGYHYFRAKNIHQDAGEFHCDYFEYVPVSYLDHETVD